MTTYRCPKGHELHIPGGTWTSLQIIHQTPTGMEVRKSFNYCMECFGEWASRQFSLDEVKS